MRRMYLLLVILSLCLLLSACDLLSMNGDPDLENTRVALAVQQTGLAMQQTQGAQVSPPTATPQPSPQPTYTPYPTYTAAVAMEPTQEEEPIVVEAPPTEVPEAPVSFEDWLDDVNILLYDDMYEWFEPQVVEKAIDGLGLGRNTMDVRDAMGNFLANMNSGTNWDLIIVAAESRNSISGEFFDVIADQMDRGTSFIIEIWYIDEIASGRIQPVMQRCGIAFHQDWWRRPNDNLNEYLVYLLEPSDPMFSEPNTISMLIPYDIMWIDDVGDMVKLNAGSDAVLLAGALPKEHNAYGLLAECLDGRMVWQTFSTHDYKTQDMINLWQNYIYNTLRARYDYLQE
ncbi:MAG: hypothetical protein ACK2TV_10310 [Anaerolineales bacterium]